ncbi:protein-disulfide reductase DsbD [Jeongeupia naejangsanensis]|uniref:Protein-disulfide reductase DsbD n=1 Tax=Jeongeupia naejangsanensis TaxID=613195 RepID=A0ABS2BMK5_9NEIS|nr:protein-disulfide reductase DsbD [Jeongeupia naejangsanensis]MBM3116665.1 protein-disulfide reductase DsbD [Jeongeupia naejangsanensis]
MMVRLLLGLLAAMLTALSHADPASLLPPDEAFRAQLVQTADGGYAVHFNVAPGYYLYRDRMSFSSEPAAALKPALPKGEFKDDPSFGRVEVFKHDVTVALQGKPPIGTAIRAKFQGCADAGVCYPPQTKLLHLGDGQDGGVAALFGASTRGSGGDRGGADLSGGTAGDDGYFSGSKAATIALFFLAGIGLALTACMYPLLPIISGIVLGPGSTGRGRALWLTAIYVQGLALTYTLVGVAAALTGTLLTVWLQQPVVIGAFALFFVAMAVAMFGGYQLQLPGSWQSRLNDVANRLPGGHAGPVFVMGALSALIVGPCVAPPLAAALAYLGQQGDVALGGGALYALALGIGTPLLIIGAAGSAVLPRLSGKAMGRMKMLFGVVLLGMAVWIARPLWQGWLPSEHAVTFEPVASVAELQDKVAAARGKPVIVDFYADWCVSCIEFERETLPDPRVKAKLDGFVRLRADVTGNTAADAELLRHFGLYGPPALLFYDTEGKLVRQRVIGFQNADAFLATLQTVEGSP